MVGREAIARTLRDGSVEERAAAETGLDKLHRAVAVHEAGHAVMDWNASLEVNDGRACERVYIVPKESQLAHDTRAYGAMINSAWQIPRHPYCNPTPIPGHRDRRIELKIMVLLAGPIAEHRYILEAGGVSTLSHLLKCRAGHSDLRRSRAYARLLRPGSFTYLKDATREFIANPIVWRTITAVANALAERQELDEQELLKVMRSAWAGAAH